MHTASQPKLSGNLTPITGNFIKNSQLPFVVDLTEMGLITVAGMGAFKLLQGQLTCDVAQVNTEHSVLGAHCTPQGRVISFFRLMQWENQYVLMMPPDVVKLAHAALQKYAVFFQVQLKPCPDDIFCLGVGATFESALLPYFAKLPQEPNACISMENVTLICVAGGTTPRYLIIGNALDVRALWQRLIQDFPVVTPALWFYLDMVAGTPSIYAATSGKYLPHELNLPPLNAVNFNKGCYTGQEIIARMHYRGQSKKRLFYATTSFAPERGHDIYANQQPCGTIVDVVSEESDRYHLLGIAEHQTSMNQELYLDLNQQQPITIVSALS